MQFLSALLLAFLVSIRVSESADLTCPKGPIDKTTPVGKFPSTGLAQFPKDYECAIDFNIASGWVIKFIVQTNAVQGSKDQITIRDSVSTLNEFSSGQSVFYAPANNSRLWITTKTNNSSFYFSWEFIDVTTYKRNEKTTGTVMKLDLTPLNYYTFISATGPVTYHAANANRELDVNLGTIFVYDGNDLNGRFIGNLMNLLNMDQMIQSSGQVLTLVNFYAYNTKSYGLANDFKAVIGYSSYAFLVLPSDNELIAHGNSLPSDTSATTFYSPQYTEAFITSLLIVNKGTGGQVAKFQPMTPTQKQNVVLSYDALNDNDPYFPQQILSDTFTLIYSKCDVSVRLRVGPNSDWNKPFAGRKGTIAPRSIWNPTASPAYSTNFSSTDMFTFSFLLQSVNIAAKGEKIRIEVGSPYSSQPAAVEFSQSASNVGARVANGTYMSTTFTATTPASDFILTFDIENVTSTLPIVTPTTPTGLQTTTKSATQGISTFVFALMIIKISMF